MRANNISIAACATLFVAALAVTTWAAAATPAAADGEKIQALQKQIDELDRELARLKGTSDPAAQRQAMQSHWAMMQNYMRSTRPMAGMGMLGSGAWMMMDPSMIGGAGMGPGMMNYPMMGHGMGMGMGAGSPGWAMPPGMMPKAYQQQMQGHMQTMRTQMAAIAAETDPAKREKLMREHYETIYRDMQTMRGMGWMWAPNASAALPDAQSAGAGLMRTYCSQCHTPPPPTLHTASEWNAVIARMRAHMKEPAAAGSGVKIPVEGELQTLDKYLSDHARTN